MRTIIPIIVSLVLFACCKSSKVGVEVHTERNDSVAVRTDSFIYTIYAQDTLIIHDSVFTLIKGDSVYIYKERETTRLRLSSDYQRESHTDTLYRYIERVDSVPYPVEVVKYKTSSPSWVVGLAIVGSGFIVGFIILAVITIIKKLKP